ncbi:MFS transporter [Micrococcales bacterium 31B]|nr:MFS transporter [Micrococcales bacterium 31B]
MTSSTQEIPIVTGDVVPAAAAPQGPGSKTPRPAGEDRPAVEARHVGLALLSLAFGGLGIGVTEFASMGLLPDFAASLGMTIPEAGHAITAYALGVVVGAPLIAILTARLPRKYLLLGLLALFTVGNGLSSLAASGGEFLAYRFLAGLPHGAYFGIAAVVASSLVKPSRRGRAVASVMLGLTIANLAGVPLATYLGQNFGWRTAYYLTAAIGITTFVLVAINVPRARQAEAGSMRSELKAFTRLRFWIVVAMGSIGFGGMFALYTYIAPVLVTVSGMRAGDVPWVLALFGLGLTLGNLGAGRLADRSVMGTIALGFASTAVILAVFALFATHMVAAVACVFALGAATQMIGPACQVKLMDSAPEGKSLAASFHHAAFNTANAAGAYLGGVVIAAGYGYVSTAWVGVALAVIGLAIWWVLGRYESRRA